MLLTVADVQARTGLTYADSELAKVNAFIEDISGLITDFCYPVIIPDPTPASVKAVAVMEVRRMLNTEPGIAQERVDNLSESFEAGGATTVLSGGAQKALTIWLRSTRPRMGSIRLVRFDQCLPTEGGA